MDADYWGIVAVLVIGTAVVAYGWLSDRAAARRQQEALASPPERAIPRFHPDEPRPQYLSELQAAVPPEGIESGALSHDARALLARRIAQAQSYPAGWAARGFVTDPASDWAVLHEPLILVCEDEVTTIRELLPALQQARSARRPLVVVTPKAGSDIVSTLQANAVQGTLSCLLVQLSAPEQRESLGALTGADGLTTDDLRSGWAPASHLGSCQTWISDKSTSWVLVDSQPSTSTQETQPKLK